eukprot:m.37488 g.37488  ORF g.37488 m.37488 type:complete len:433 (+) comp12509_c0_seq1:140-1438(+)
MAEDPVQVLKDLSGLPEDRCRQILQDNNNDVDRAASFILEHFLEPQSATQDTARDAEVAAAMQADEDGLRQRRPPTEPSAPPAPAATPQPQPQAPFDWLAFLTQGSLGMLRNVFGALWQFVGAFITTLIPGLRPFAEPVPVGQQLQERYPTLALPPIRQGTFSEAAAASRREIKFLCVYIHSAAASGNENFAQLLASPPIMQFFNDQTILWATDIATREGFATAAQLRAFSYPFLALLLPDDGALKLIWSHQDASSLTPSALAAELRSKAEQFEAVLIAQRADRASVASSQVLRQEQDAAFQQSLLEDQRKAEERRRQEESEQAAQQEAANAVAQREARLARLQVEFPAEPETGDDVVKIAVQLPHRQRVSRRFKVTDTVGMLYDYVFLQDKIEGEFRLFKNQPKQELANMAQSLADYGLTTNTLLLCQVED